MKPTKSKNGAVKIQPKISNFLVPSDPFSNKSPSKQLKISSFFKKVDSKNSQEENICSNSGNQGAVGSPECILASPEAQKKRKRKEESCTRKLIKLENYNKLLYDESENYCQIMESTSVCSQSKHKTNKNIHKVLGKIKENKKHLNQEIDSTHGLKQTSSKLQMTHDDILEPASNQAQETKQESWKRKHSTNYPKFQTRTEKILNNVEITKEVQDKSRTKHTRQDTQISNPKFNLMLNIPSTDKHKQTVSSENCKIDSSKFFVSSIKSNSAIKANTESILKNDNLLYDLLGELDTKSDIEEVEKHIVEAFDEPIVKNESVKENINEALSSPLTHKDEDIGISSMSEFMLDSDSCREVENKSCLMKYNDNTKQPNTEELYPESAKKLVVIQESNNVSTVAEANREISTDQLSVGSTNPYQRKVFICEKSKQVHHSEPESNSNSVSSLLGLYGVQHCTPTTPEKEVQSEKQFAALTVPLTPEKSEEVSSISQEVAAVLSVTKSPNVNSPAKQFTADLSAISKINFDDDDDDVDWDFSNIDSIEKFDLSQFKKCEISQIDCINNSQLKLHLKYCESEASAWCLMLGSWVHTQLQVGDIVNIKAEYSSEHGAWVVDNTRGLVVFQPDILVSGTSVVGALFCMRKSILADMFKGVDSGSSIMVLGILLHEFLQEVLKNNLRSELELRTLIASLLSSQETIAMLYSSLMSLEDTRQELLAFIPRIRHFLDTYVDATKTPGRSSWPGRILSVQDIEENIWLPNLGIKGKVDVTVRVRSRNVVKTLPLELKTGRASKSAEHRGQVILYAMMMSEMGDNPVDSGLLLYLREDILDEVRSGHPEKRDLLMLRNQLVFYMNQGVRGVETPVLPPPIHHHSACSKCPYLYLCSSALREEGAGSLSDDNPLKDLSSLATSHLTEAHIRFVFHMTALVRMEFQAMRHKSKQVSDVWNLDPETREARGDCICNLSLEPGVVSVKSRYSCSLSRPHPISSLMFSLSQYVIVSSSIQPAVASGFITAQAECSLTLSLDRDLSAISATGVKFHVDTYESQSLMTFNLTGLGLLLEKEHRNNAILRSLIIDRVPPRFSRKHHASILDVGGDLLSRLNAGQKKAVLKVLTAKDYLLIKGMPGTGKSSTLACLIELLVRLKLSVLVTSHTHSAVDNLLMRLVDKVPFLRLGSVSRVHPSILPHSDVICSRHCTSPEQLAEVYASRPVVGVTCMGSIHPLLQKRTFDICIVDEATQVLLPAVLPPLLSARKFILVGDPEQLCPLVVSREAGELGLSESLFSRLDRPEVTTCLTSQYRMNRFITQLVNRFTYRGELECADETVANATIPELNSNSDQPWLQKCLSHQLESSVIFLNVNCDKSNEMSNEHEADIANRLVSAFLEAGIPSDHIGVMATYRNQVSLLKRLIQNEGVEINTVDQYQGRDKSIILYSSTCTSQSKESKILNDRKRLTVAISRSKHKFILLGDSRVISRTHSVLNELVQYMTECGSILNV